MAEFAVVSGSPFTVLSQELANSIGLVSNIGPLLNMELRDLLWVDGFIAEQTTSLDVALLDLLELTSDQGPLTHVNRAILVNPESSENILGSEEYFFDSLGLDALEFDYSENELVFVAETIFIRGDCNGDAGINIADAIFILTQLFGQNPPLRPCDVACDTNGDDNKDIADSIYLLNFLFVQGAPPPPAPYPDCEPNTNPGTLGCEEYPPCP